MNNSWVISVSHQWINIFSTSISDVMYFTALLLHSHLLKKSSYMARPPTRTDSPSSVNLLPSSAIQYSCSNRKPCRNAVPSPFFFLFFFSSKQFMEDNINCTKWLVGGWRQTTIHYHCGVHLSDTMLIPITGSFTR